MTPTARRLRAVLPWLGAALLLVWAFRRTSLVDLAAALRSGPWLALAAFAALEVVVVLAVDVWATRIGLARTGLAVEYRDLLLVRGATYLLGLVNYVIGQGGIGLYLSRKGFGRARSAGAVLFLLATNGLALAASLAVGLWLDDSPATTVYRPVAVVIGAGFLVYLALLLVRWPPSLRWPILEPLLGAGVRGHVAALSARLVHVAALLLGNWIALRVWGIAAPVVTSVSRLPVVVVGSALPITPNGVGAVQALLVSLFETWAPGADQAARAASTLAFGLAHQALGLLLQGAIGLFCIGRLRRDAP